MTYSSGGLIQAADYNGFANNTSSGNVNATWSTGTGDAGWGQTALSTVSTGGIVTATQWASLVNTTTSMGSQTNTTLTSRTAPVTGDTVNVFANLGTDITNCYTNRGNAASSGTISSTWTGNVAKTTSTGNGVDSWTITFTHVITFPSADQARYFWNAGGLVRLDMSKTSTGEDKDADWNAFVATVGTLFISGRVAGAAQTIAGTSYTGLTRSGGSGTPSPFLTTTGWYTLTGGAAATTMFQLNESTYPYSGDYIRVTAAVNSERTELTLVVTWYDAAEGTASNTISGGTDTTSPYSSFGTAPAVLCRAIPPSTDYLTNTWGTPTIASSVDSPALPYLVNFYAVAGGGSGGGNTGDGTANSSGAGGGAGGYVVESLFVTENTSYSIVIGAGAGASAGSAGATGSNTTGFSITAYGGGGGGWPYSPGSNGGSGGGSCSGSGGLAVPSTQGNNGGGVSRGGGGGASAVGQDGNVSGTAGAGGAGIANPVPGSTIGQNSGGTYYLAGGGGGGGSLVTGQQPAAGGVGGGGAGSLSGGGTSGTTNTGGGGGGAGNSADGPFQFSGGSGGSGVAMVTYQSTNPIATGGTITTYTSGGNTYWVHTFTTSGNFVTT